MSILIIGICIFFVAGVCAYLSHRYATGVELAASLLGMVVGALVIAVGMAFVQVGMG